MKNYVEELGLSFDPFEPSASKKEFYGGGHRQDLCNQIVESAMYGENIIAVYGRLGSGKSMLTAEITRSFADEAVSALILATLFMNSEQFVEGLADQLDLPTTDFGKEKVIEEISELAHQLDLEAKSLLIQIDDAHELSRDVLLDILKIKSVCPPNSVHFVLFGEDQLANMLQSILTVEQGAGLIEFEIPSFASDATIDYVRFKLEKAGYSKPLPMSGADLGSIHNTSEGIPGVINGLASEILEREYQVAVSNGAMSDFDLDEGPANRRDEGEQDAESSRSPAFFYMIAASVLVVVFLAAIVFIRPESQSPNSETSIPVATTSMPIVRSVPEPVQAPAVDTGAAASIATPLSGGVSTSPASTGQVVRQPLVDEVNRAAPGAASLAETLNPKPAVESAEVLPREEVAAKVVAPKPIAAAKPTAPAPVSTQTAATTEPSDLSSFERKLLKAPRTSYVVQILGASSEANIQAFIDKEKIDSDTGYFKTSLNGKPWFVVLVGTFSDKSSATVAMNGLPATAKAYGPWVRSIADIQSAIVAKQRSN